MAATDVTMHEPADRVDGRRARRERGRLAVMDAMVDLVNEGHSPPTAETVAERAGVSVSSLFRYFENLDDLRTHTAQRFFERYADRFEIPDVGIGTFDQRVTHYVVARIELYEAIAPLARLARSRMFRHPDLVETFTAVRLGYVEQIRTHFAAELDHLGPAARDDVVASVVALTSVEAWDLFHRDLERSRRQIRRAWSDAIRALLT